MLETTTKTRGHWAASWPATFDDATDVNWARDETAKKCFAFDLINVLIADAILPHAAERVRHRRSERIAAMLKRGSGADSNPPKKRKAKKLAKSKQHRQREPEHEAEPEKDYRAGGLSAYARSGLSPAPRELFWDLF